MENTPIVINNIKPKKLKLADYDLGQTLGTGINLY